MINLRRLLAGLILVAVLALTLVIWRHLQSQTPKEILQALPDQVDLALQELHYTQNEEGKRSWTLDAAKAEYRRDEGVALLEEVELTLYDSGHFGEVTLTARQGSLQQEEQLIEAWGDVVVTTGRGEKLYTDRLQFDGERRLLFSDEKVRMIGPRGELTGRGLQVDVAAGRMSLAKDVWMLLLPEEAEGGSGE